MPTMPTMPEAGFPANPFDFSSMAGLLNDPNIKELAAQIAKDPSLNRMTEQLQQTFHAPDEGVPQFDTQQCYSTMQQVMQNPQFMTMAERLGNVMMQDPSMSQTAKETRATYFVASVFLDQRGGINEHN